MVLSIKDIAIFSFNNILDSLCFLDDKQNDFEVSQNGF